MEMVVWQRQENTWEAVLITRHMQSLVVHVMFGVISITTAVMILTGSGVAVRM